MRADRLLSILLLLQAHARLTAADLARRLEVSPRTVLRDMDALSAAGVPVYARRGGGGGWALLGAYRTDLTGLTELEAQALFATAPSPVLHDIGLGRPAEAALRKLLAALPARHHPGAAHTRQRLHVDGAGWGRRPEDSPPPHLHTVQEAVWRDRRLRIRYERSDDVNDPRPPDVSERRLHPLGLVAKGGAWYLVAAVDGEGGAGGEGEARAGGGGVGPVVRAYRVSRIRAAEVLEQPSLRPPGFDLAAYWEGATAHFKASVPRYDATVRVGPAALPLVRKSQPYRRAAREDGPARTTSPPGMGADGGGWEVVRLRFEVEDEAIPFVLRFGGAAEVLEPDGLREQELARAVGVVARHSRRPAVPAGAPDTAW
jgi:predicted DNA-binding transcriptional regulator YafY